MLHYDIIDVFEGIETSINKTNVSKEYDICHYLYFLDKGFTFQTHFNRKVLKFAMLS